MSSVPRRVSAARKETQPPLMTGDTGFNTVWVWEGDNHTPQDQDHRIPQDHPLPPRTPKQVVTMEPVAWLDRTIRPCSRALLPSAAPGPEVLGVNGLREILTPLMGEWLSQGPPARVSGGLCKVPRSRAAMDVSYCSAALLPEIHSPGPFDYEALLGQSCWAAPACDQASDPGYFSATGSSLSPTSSVDSFSFSPAHLSAAGPEPDTLDCLLSSLNRLTGVTTEPDISCCSTRTQKSSSPAKTTTTTTSTTRRSWSRFPGRKRQTASEREKLRMRDLTKSLNYLRSFLPASVAPVEQTLTKIETLRLTMRYISHLSAQLGHGQEVPETRGTSPPTQQNPAFQPILEQPNVGYVPEEPQHHYQHVAMDTAEWACGAQHQNQTTQHILLQNYQGSGSFCSPWLSGQNWTSPDLLQQTTFSS
ncbi:unnamed protein product [Merluccius merluccius]